VRVQVISAIIRPPELYVPRGAAGEVTQGGELADVAGIPLGSVTVRMDDGTVVKWEGQNVEHLAHEVEIEPEDAGRFRMIELNPKNNPAWVTKLFAATFEDLEDEISKMRVPAAWMPKLTKTRSKRGKFIADLKEYGCGVYGCVLPSLDPKIVIKLTTDDSEADFAKNLASKLAAQVTVKYHLIAALPEKHKRMATFMLWRDSADHVGDIDKVMGKRADRVERAIDKQHKAAQAAYRAMMAGKPAMKLIQKWEKSVADMGDKVPELGELASGMIENLHRNQVFMGDVHAGNLGMVDGKWLIIDPGNIAVLTGRQ
jgi:hypothetical protein